MKNPAKWLNIVTLSIVAVMTLYVITPLFVVQQNAYSINQQDDEDFTIISDVEEGTNISGEGPASTSGGLNASQMVSAAFGYINGSMPYNSTTNGVVNTSVPVVGSIMQNIYGSCQRDSAGKVLFFTASVKNASLGVTIGRQVYKTEDRVYYRDAKSVSKTFEASYDEGWNNTTSSAYMADFGTIPGKCDYIVDENTILSYNNYAVSNNGQIRCVITLDVDKALTNYIRYVESMSGSTTRPEFEYVKLTITTNSEGLPVRLAVEEKYVITVMGIKATCINSTATKYYNWGRYSSIASPQGVY